MRSTVACPTCGATDLDLCSYESMMVLRPNLALFSLTCPHCSTRLSSLQPIPAALRDEVMFTAIELGAGMGAHEGTS